MWAAEMAAPVEAIAVNRAISGKALDKPSKVHATQGPNLLIRRFCAAGTGNPFLPAELQPASATGTSTGGNGLFNCRLDAGRASSRGGALRSAGGVCIQSAAPCAGFTACGQSGFARPGVCRVLPAAVHVCPETRTTDS